MFGVLQVIPIRWKNGWWSQVHLWCSALHLHSTHGLCPHAQYEGSVLPCSAKLGSTLPPNLSFGNDLKWWSNIFFPLLFWSLYLEQNCPAALCCLFWFSDWKRLNPCGQGNNWKQTTFLSGTLGCSFHAGEKPICFLRWTPVWKGLFPGDPGRWKCCCWRPCALWGCQGTGHIRPATRSPSTRCLAAAPGCLLHWCNRSAVFLVCVGPAQSPQAPQSCVCALVSRGARVASPGEMRTARGTCCWWSGRWPAPALWGCSLPPLGFLCQWGVVGRGQTYRGGTALQHLIQKDLEILKSANHEIHLRRIKIWSCFPRILHCWVTLMENVLFMTVLFSFPSLSWNLLYPFLKGFFSCFVLSTNYSSDEQHHT